MHEYILAYGNPQNGNMEEEEGEGEEATQCDENRSPLEKCLITILILLVCIVCGLVVFVMTLSAEAKCTTTACIKQAAWIQNILSRETNPCDDFYKFVCPANNEVKDTERRLKATVEKQLKNVLSETLMIKDHVSLRAAKKMFRACLDVKHKKRHLDAAYHAIVRWGLLNENVHWLEFLQVARERGLGYDLIFDISVVDNVAGNGESILRIGPPNVVIARMGHTNDEAQFLKDLDEITDRGLNSYTTEYTTMGAFEETYGFSPWSLLLNMSLDISENTTILVAAPDYFSDLTELLIITKESIVVKYMQRHILKTIFDEYLQWTNYDEELESSCAEKTKQLLPDVMQLAYIRKYHTKAIHEEVKAIALNIKNELLKILKSAEWLNQKTKTYITDIIENIGFFIGAPDSFVTDDVEFPEEASANTSNFLLMVLQAKKHNRDRHYATLKENQVYEELTGTILSIYPFYSFRHNLIVLPAAMLQNPIFHLERPKYLNYGLLGTIIGRELMRAFVNFAMQSHEECLDVDWSWTLKQFQCFKEQFHSHNYSDVSDERFVRGEAVMVDVAGTKLAYLAYENNIPSYELDLPLVGFNFTAKQMFWVARGLYRCYFETFLANDPALSYMVMSPFINLKTFGGDFDCYKKKFSDIIPCDAL